MKFSLLFIAALFWTFEVCCDQLFTFRGQPIQKKLWGAFYARQSRQLVCISDNPLDAITWNTPLQWMDRSLSFVEKNNMTGPELSYNRPNAIIDCQFNDKSAPCFSRWSQQPTLSWRITNSLEVPMGPIFDSRWEVLKEFEISTQVQKQSTQITTFGSTGSIVVSLRGGPNAHFFLCRTLHQAWSICYWITIGSLERNGAVVVQRCDYYINDGGFPRRDWTCFHLPEQQFRDAPLSNLEWRTFVITWREENQSINIYDPYKLVASFTDNLPIQNDGRYRAYKVFIDYQLDFIPKNYRIHKYDYTLATQPNAEWRIQQLTLPYSSNFFCLSLLIGLCSKCDLEISLWDASNNRLKKETFYGNVVSQKADHDLPLWQHVKFKVTNNRTYLFPITIRMLTKLSESEDNPNYHWAIADVRECLPEETVKRISLFAVQDWSLETKYVWPSITCQKLSYNHEVMLVDPNTSLNDNFQPQDYPNDSQLCPKLYFGPHCATLCSTYFPIDCRHVTMCDKRNCYCEHGVTGNKCDDYCTAGYYGYGCRNKCGSCAQTSFGRPDCDKFTGICDQCQSSETKYFIPPHCKDDSAVDAPSKPIIKYTTETSARVDHPMLENYNKINASFQFELERQNGSYVRVSARLSQDIDYEDSRSLTATFTDLTAGTQFNVRMEILMSDKIHYLNGEWGSFTTKCHSSLHYNVTPEETLLTIHKSSNLDALNYCPESWYNVKIFHTSQWKKGAITWPVILKDLPPYTWFNVQIIGLDGSQQFQTRVQTLEAEPSKVRDLGYNSVDSTSAEVTWNPPANPNGKIEGYQIRIQLAYYKGCKEIKQSQTSNLEQYQNITTISPDRTSYTIIDLKPYAGYYVFVSAYHSKQGNVDVVTIETREMNTPTEHFVDLKFLKENSTLIWHDPDCSTITGPIAGARLIFTGLSQDVKNFSHIQITRKSEFELNSFNSNHIAIHGLETYRVQIHVTRDVDGNHYNSKIFSSLDFTTPPSAPPEVENLEIVQVDSLNNVATLRWQKPLPPTNGRISHYQILFARGSLSRSFKVQTNNVCRLWKNWLCTTVNNREVSSKFIEVKAYNEDVKKPGVVAKVPNRFTEKEADAPQNVNFHSIGHGMVNLEWSHPWKTGGPLINFIIKSEVISTNLSQSLSKEQYMSILKIPMTESTYKTNYSELMNLLPSTSYKIQIQGVGRQFLGRAAEFNVITQPSFTFDKVQSPVINAEESQINIFIPAIINDTKTNIIDIIVIGPPRCNDTVMISDILANDLELESYTDAWCVATFATSDKANTPFSIGDGKLHKNRDNNTNCRIFDGSYRISFLVRDKSHLEKIEKPLIWISGPIKIGSIMERNAPEKWAMPLVLMLAIVCGAAWFYLRHRKKTVTSETEEKYNDTEIFPLSLNDFPLPLSPSRKLPQNPCNGVSLLAESQESIEEFGNEIQGSATIGEGIYENGTRSSLVKLNEFHDYVKNGIASGEIIMQYDKFPRGQTKSWEYGKLPQNRMKNRYANLIAYDETRVILEKLPNEPFSDYINANYVQGYKKNKSYIATQGPKQNTVNDFWRMIWQERVEVICMLANVFEGGKKKCEQYWPEIGKKCKFGNIIVNNISHTTFADYTFRIFYVTFDQESRKIQHLHYTAWPDHGVPLYTQSVVTYLKKLLATPAGHGPIVIHCSAGIGRTGTIILCDTCLRRAAAEGVVDVFAETAVIRSQRANMVDNHQQYLLAHLTLVECLLTLPTAIPCNDALLFKIQEYKQQLPSQFQRLNNSVWQDKALQSSATKPAELSKTNYPKNRYPELAAAVGQKIHISRYPTSDDDSDYMFGVYVDSARSRNNYIASQLPLPSTVNDFWRMISEFKVEVIIVLQPPDKDNSTCCKFEIEVDEDVKPTPFLALKGKDVIEEDICTRRKILLTDSIAKPAGEQTVTILSMKGWDSGENKPPPKPIILVDFWQYAERISRGDGPTVVLCHDGVTNCGLYLALSFLLERMGLERECDVCLAIRAIRRSRPDFCKTLEQLEYLYDAAVIYADYFETYANFI